MLFTYKEFIFLEQCFDYNDIVIFSQMFFAV